MSCDHRIATRIGCLILGLLVGLADASASSRMQQDESSVEDVLVPEIFSARVGFEGYYKIGFWTHVIVETSKSSTNVGEFRLICPDGDGTETLFNLRPVGQDEIREQQVEGTSSVYTGLIRVGRLDVALRLQWTDDNGRVIREWSLSEFANPRGLKSTDELLVVFGEPEPIRSAIARSKAADSDRFLVQLKDVSTLPPHWLGWDVVDRLVINSATESLIPEMTSSQTTAIESWIRQGGDVTLAMGASADSILADGNRLESRLIPGVFDEVVDHSDTAGFETYALANDQLLGSNDETIAIARLSNVTGQVEAFEGRDQYDLPLVVRSPLGFGHVTFLAIDIDEPNFAKWEGRNRFLAKVLNVDARSGEAGNREGRSGRVSHLGYTDLSGQLRSAMDRFQEVQLITFTWVAILIVLFILCIGPADYFLLKQVVRRMEWTWLTFSIFVILFCSIAIATVGLTKGSSVQINAIEVVDVDLSSETVRGSLWLTVYSPESQRYSISFSPAESGDAIRVGDRLIGWQGLPGTGLGAMDSAIATSTVGQPYACDIKRFDNELVSELESVPIQVASTKTFFGRWSGALEKRERGELILDSRSNSLSGSIINPLDVKLTNCVVLYGSWAYVVEDELEPGASIDIERDTIERTLDAFLTRRRRNAGRDETKEWDPTSDNTSRIAEMLSFFKVAGGENYTSLTQRLHHGLDLSDHLTPGQAILVGTAEARSMNVQLNGEDGSSFYDQSSTHYRLVVPVRDPLRRDKP